jgi:2-haloacid dehalogenase
MNLDRRTLMLRAGEALATVAVSPLLARAPAAGRIRAVAFDAFPILDPRPLVGLAETLFPGRGTELSDAWRARQFEYQWLRVLMGRYADFWRTADDALAFAARLLKLDLTAEKRGRLMGGYRELKAWPDVPAALQALKSSGLRLIFLSNMTRSLLDAGIENSKLDGVFEQVLSTDAIRSYKPDPKAYRMGIDALKLRREEIVFAAFAGWDAAGASSFGYPTYWVNRLGAPEEELQAPVAAMGRNLTDLVEFVRAGA